MDVDDNASRTVDSGSEGGGHFARPVRLVAAAAALSAVSPKALDDQSIVLWIRRDQQKGVGRYGIRHDHSRVQLGHGFHSFGILNTAALYGRHQKLASQ